MNYKLSRYSITTQNKELLEQISGQKIFTKNTFDLNQKAINSVLDQGKQNALVYLERNQLGQKLSIFEENNIFKAVVDLQQKLSLNKKPRRIECYDISHISGKFVYGSMVVFIDGLPVKKYYRLFKCPDKNDDFANHREVLTRRLNRALNLNPDKIDKTWQLPDLIIVDGGKGQLSSDIRILDEFKIKFNEQNTAFDVEICSLAKKEEEVFLPYLSESVRVTGNTRFLIQRIRDEAHRFAITNNRNARLKTASKSQLDEIAGIGPKTKQKLLSIFGSVSSIIDQLYKNPEIIDEAVGVKASEKLKKALIGGASQVQN